MFPGDELFFTGVGGDRIAQIHIVCLAAALCGAEDAAHLAVADDGLYGTGIGAADPCHASVLCLEDEMHGILMMQAAFPAVGAQHAIAHDLGDIGKVPADEIDGVAEAAIEPFKGRFQRPALFEEPAMVGMVVSFDGDEFADEPVLIVLPLASHGFEEPRALTDKYLFARGGYEIEDGLCLGK